MQECRATGCNGTITRDASLCCTPPAVCRMCHDIHRWTCLAPHESCRDVVEVFAFSGFGVVVLLAFVCITYHAVLMWASGSRTRASRSAETVLRDTFLVERTTSDEDESLTRAPTPSPPSPPPSYGATVNASS